MSPPDDPNQTAVAEAEAPAVPAAPIGEEAVPAGPEERPPEEEGAAEEAGPEEEAPKPGEEEPSAAQQVMETLQEAAKDDPELANLLKDTFGEKAEGVEEREAQLEVRETQGQRQTDLNSAWGYAARYGPEQVNKVTTDWASGEVATIRKALQDAVGAENANAVQIDASKWADTLSDWMQKGQAAYGNAIGVQNQTVFLNAVQAHPSFRTYPAEMRQGIAQLRAGTLSPDQYGQLVWAVLETVQQAAPEHVKKQTRQELEQELGAADKFKALLEKLPKGGKRPQATAAKAADTFEELEELVATGNPTDQQWATYRKMRRDRGLE